MPKDVLSSTHSVGFSSGHPPTFSSQHCSWQTMPHSFPSPPLVKYFLIELRKHRSFWLFPLFNKKKKCFSIHRVTIMCPPALFSLCSVIPSFNSVAWQYWKCFVIASLMRTHWWWLCSRSLASVPSHQVSVHCSGMSSLLALQMLCRMQVKITMCGAGST